MKLIITVLLVICFSAGFSQEKLTLKVEVHYIDKIEGTIRSCLVRQEEEYLGRCRQFLDLKVNDEKMLLVFEDLEPGTYCITLYHDEDNNGQLNRGGLFGMPSEPYGFSNNPRSWFGPPSYEDCVFEVKGDKRIIVEL